MRARQRGRPRLLAMPGGAVEAAHAGDDAARIALRLYRVHRGESIRALEALAVAEANRLQAAGARPRPGRTPAPPPTDARYRACLRAARRALAGTLVDEVAGATRYHRREAEPPWARRRIPAVEIGGFLFYRAEA